MNEEIIEIISEEIVKFTLGYFMMMLMTKVDFKFKKENKNFRIGQYGEEYRGSRHFFTRHQIHKAGRTKIRFYFNFFHDELDYALNLNKLLDGYVDYRFYAYARGYGYDFTLDVGSKENSEKFFNNLNF